MSSKTFFVLVQKDNMESTTIINMVDTALIVEGSAEWSLESGSLQENIISNSC